ncbi:hypothetical protein C1H46_021522 [Malus baccata]|uniref:Leucine-rich repeat-containing N-terminal plant-type domain-containing protein n=1 Tax=Malus baccata TaxID=106549 RepID=A0A540M2X5_MALBA|nr:hypothetical protein C1H46_021522 [Malus baccata]
MSGEVPDGIAELSSLETLLLWNNLFSGNLPRSLGRNSKLGWVDVSTNNFNGSVPPDICANGQLLKLMLFSNNFSGDLSTSLSNCLPLVHLRLEDNKFSEVSNSAAPSILHTHAKRNKRKQTKPESSYDEELIDPIKTHRSKIFATYSRKNYWITEIRLLAMWLCINCNESHLFPHFCK